jgi:hypothetical protein
MDHVKVLKRALEITWRYRALWIFGIILALVTASGGPSNFGGGGGGNGGPSQYEFNGDEFPFGGEDFPFGGEFPLPEMPQQFPPEILPRVGGILIAAGVGLACLALVLIIAGVIARYVAETALIRMVDEHEDTGQKASIRQGFRLGWSRSAWRMFLIKLVIGIPKMVVFGVLFVLAAAPLFLWLTKSTAAGVIGTVAAIGLFLLLVFLAIIVSVAISLLMRFFWRACALEGLGVFDAIREGFGLVRRHLGDVLIMGLIMIGIRIGWVIAMVAITIVLLPAIILLIILAVLLGGAPALVVFGIASLLFEGAVPFILAAMIGLPIFILVVALPWLFLGGLVEVFRSSVWTLTYRELRALEGLETEDTETETPPALEAPGLA